MGCPATAFAPLPPGYRPRHPETTCLHEAVSTHCSAFKEELAIQHPDGFGLPRYIERTLDAYLACGDFRRGFTRLVCEGCRHEVLVGFSCKRRGFCPSCCARRGADSALHLSEQASPRGFGGAVPIRQWVLTFPKRVRYHLARSPTLLCKVVSGFMQGLLREYERRAEAEGQGGTAGAVCCIQWFGSYLNVNPHLHVFVADGVYQHSANGARLHPLGPPREGEVYRLLLKTGEAVLERLEAHFEDTEVSFTGELDHLLAASVSGTTGGSRGGVPSPQSDRFCAHIDGFSLHAGVHVHENDLNGRERLLGYGTRGPVALSRLEKLDDGRYAYHPRRAIPGRTGPLVLTGTELISRLVALVPPPFLNLVRYFGAFAPNAKIRPRAVAKPPPAPKQEGILSVLLEHARQIKRRYRRTWAELLKRVHAVDVQVCAKCGARMRPIATIKDPAVAARILRHLGLADHPPPALPRSPPQLELFAAA